MNIQQYTNDIYISGQILPEEIQVLIADYGFLVIVNNRIDGEEAIQPDSKILETICKDAHIAYYYIPMHHRGDINEDSLAMRDYILHTHQNEKKLFFCRTGGRSESLLNHS